MYFWYGCRQRQFAGSLSRRRLTMSRVRVGLIFETDQCIIEHVQSQTKIGRSRKEGRFQTHQIKQERNF